MKKITLSLIAIVAFFLSLTVNGEAQAFEILSTKMLADNFSEGMVKGIVEICEEYDMNDDTFNSKIASFTLKDTDELIGNNFNSKLIWDSIDSSYSFNEKLKIFEKEVNVEVTSLIDRIGKKGFMNTLTRINRLVEAIETLETVL
jgi:hypothetical protein